MTVLPGDYGKGWLSGNAADLVRIAVAFGGYDAREVTVRLAAAGTPGRRTNIRTVEKVLGEIRHNWKNKEHRPGESV